MLTTPTEYGIESRTFSLISQGKFRFYSLTLLIKVLARTCFASPRYDDPIQGFQRTLDKARAQAIADYIDSGETTIPNSIILSAQNEAAFGVKRGGRALSFVRHPKAFLILDGQHRVYGFTMAKTDLRVPVIIYSGLTRQQEIRLFIDINTKQKPVPNELLLDIKRLADIENDEESLLRDIFDLFNKENDSILLGLMSPSERISGKLSRVSFNSSCKPILPSLGDRSPDELYEILNAYLSAFASGLDRINYREIMLTPYGFKAIMGFFPDVASRVKGQYSAEYSTENFADLLQDMFNNITKSQLSNTKNSAKGMQDVFKRALARGFRL